MLLPTQTQIRQAERICDDFEAALKSGSQPRLEEYLAQSPEDADLLRHLLPLEWEYRLRAGEHPQSAEYEARFAEAAELIAATARELTAAAWFDNHPQTLLGPYRILREVGRGGMGVVYEALHESQQRRVALKILRKMDLANPAALERFWREAQTTARLQHPHVVQMLEVGEAEGQLFLALEFVEGRSLEEELRRGPLAPLPAARLVETLARTMHHAHRQGVIHRDLKPANVLLQRCECGDCVPKIADFGLARPVGGRDLTMTGDLFGTPGYMAPEQTWGKCGMRRIGPPADVYSLGAILYAALTGRAPFAACTALDTLEMVRFQDPIRPARLRSGVPRDLETICLKCLEKDPLRRYASAAGLADDLRRFQAGEPIAARRACCAQRLTRWCRRNALPLFGVAALVAATWLGTAQSFQIQLRQQQTLAQTARRDADVQRKELTSQIAVARSVRMHGEPPPRARECPLGAWNYSLLRMAMRMFVV